MTCGVNCGATTMTVGDDLLARIHEAVRQAGVPVSQQPIVIELVGRSLITIINDPAFYTQLRPMLELRAENERLRQALLAVQVQMRQAVVKASPRKRTAKPKVVKKAPGIRVKGSTPANRRAFKEGFRGS